MRAMRGRSGSSSSQNSRSDQSKIEPASRVAANAQVDCSNEKSQNDELNNSIRNWERDYENLLDEKTGIETEHLTKMNEKTIELTKSEEENTRYKRRIDELETFLQECDEDNEDIKWHNDQFKNKFLGC